MSDTGIAPGFGGFATSAAGQLQYLNRLHNPYAFLQQQPSIAGGADENAPAAAQSFARGGLSGVSPQQEQQWARFMHYHRIGGWRRGGLVRLADGGDASDGDAASDSGGFDSGGFGNADGGFDAGFGTAAGSQADQAAATQNSPFDAPGIEVGQQLGFNHEDVDPVALGVTAMGKGIASAVPGGGLAMSAAKAAGFDPAAAATSALGGHALGPGASMGASIGSTLGGIGGPLGSALGAAIGGFAGAHGEMGSGALGGTGSTAGTAGTATSGPASTNGSGFASNMGMDAPAPGSQVGLGGPNGTAQNPDVNSGVSDVTDLSALIKRINAALQSSATRGYAAGGSVAGGGGSNHAFHRGSGLFQGTSGGRSDALRMDLPRGGYVVPADVVSGLGEGNTLSGARKLKAIIPKQPSRYAAGGSVHARVSDGEFWVHPAHVAALGNGDLKAGSDKLDQMVGHVRRINQRQVNALPPPR